jgi:hypothetical protein
MGIVDEDFHELFQDLHPELGIEARDDTHENESQVSEQLTNIITAVPGYL